MKKTSHNLKHDYARFEADGNTVIESHNYKLLVAEEPLVLNLLMKNILNM